MGKSIVITGGTKGIGLAIAHRFAANGYDILVCSRTESDLDVMKSVFEKEYPDIKILTKAVDMSKKSEVLDFAAWLMKQKSQIEILVNNAGVFLPGEITKEPDGKLEAQIETNLYSAYHLTRALLPHIPENGHIINMCSVASIIAYPNGGSYSISKFAMLGFSKVLREELKPKNIKVTSIMPGATWSASWEGVELPEERLMQASDIAESVWSVAQMSPAACVEEVVIRPQLGDL
ncbi:MAG: SDR family oxidoreductase [Saprospiraceae bacterium]